MGLPVLPAPASASAGQALLEPLQLSATSQEPEAERQTLPALFTPSAEQETLEPSQYSALSQASVALRHTVEALARASAGQAALEPEQNSAGSHTPAEPRHCTVEGTMLHVPTLPGRLQESQAPPLHAVLQHTPSTQLPLPHWLLAVQVTPGVCFGTHAPSLQ